MRILFLASWFPSRVHPTHGNFVAKHARLVAKEHELVVLHVQDDPKMKVGELELVSQQTDGYQQYQCFYGQRDNTPGWRKIWLRWRAWNKLSKQYLSQHKRPDCLHAHVLLDAGIFAAHLGRKWQRPFVITEHSTAYWTPDALPGIRGWLGSWASRRAAAILPVTPALGRAMQQQGLAGKYGSVSNVVDENIFHFKAPPPAPFVLLHISNFRQWHKNVHGLIRAFRMASEQTDQEIILQLAGDGDLEVVSEMVDDVYRSSNSGLQALPSNIRLTGQLTEAEVAQSMQASHAFVLFSNVENQPVVLLEALCCGRPCIATRVGGIEDILNEDNGIIVESKDEAALSAAILTMVENYSSYKHEQISEAAINNYGEQAILAQFTAAYRKATKQ